MAFFSRWGYLVTVFFLVAAFIAIGIGIAYHLSPEFIGVLSLLFWGSLCVFYGMRLDKPEKPSSLFGIRMEYWGYGIIGLAILDAYVSWGKIARDWLAVV